MYEDDLYIFDISTEKTMNLFENNNYEAGSVFWANDSQSFYVSTLISATHVLVYSIDDLDNGEDYEFPNLTRPIKWSSDGKMIYYIQNSQHESNRQIDQVYVMNLEGCDYVQLTNFDSEPEAFFLIEDYP